MKFQAPGTLAALVGGVGHSTSWYGRLTVSPVAVPRPACAAPRAVSSATIDKTLEASRPATRTRERDAGVIRRIWPPKIRAALGIDDTFATFTTAPVPSEPVSASHARPCSINHTVSEITMVRSTLHAAAGR